MSVLQFRFAIASVALLLVPLTATPAAGAGPEIGTSRVFAIGPGHTFIDWVPGASSTLVRTTNGVNASLQTSGLPAGHAVTMWALIFNNPSACGAGGCDDVQKSVHLPHF